MGRAPSVQARGGGSCPSFRLAMLIGLRRQASPLLESTIGSILHDAAASALPTRSRSIEGVPGHRRAAPLDLRRAAGRRRTRRAGAAVTIRPRRADGGLVPANSPEWIILAVRRRAGRAHPGHRQPGLPWRRAGARAAGTRRRTAVVPGRRIPAALDLRAILGRGRGPAAGAARGHPLFGRPRTILLSDAHGPQRAASAGRPVRRSRAAAQYTSRHDRPPQGGAAHTTAATDQQRPARPSSRRASAPTTCWSTRCRCSTSAGRRV